MMIVGESSADFMNGSVNNVDVIPTNVVCFCVISPWLASV